MVIQQCFAANLFAGKTIFGSGGGSGINSGWRRISAAVLRKYQEQRGSSPPFDAE
jgi:hypothetical protein